LLKVKKISKANNYSCGHNLQKDSAKMLFDG